MNKKWYIKIEGKTEGPYSISQLRRHKKVTPDTFVWDSERAVWVPLRTIPELRKIFKDEEPEPSPEEEVKPTEKELSSELVMELQSGLPPILFWILILLIILILFVAYR